MMMEPAVSSGECITCFHECFVSQIRFCAASWNGRLASPDPQAGDLVVPGAEVEQAGHLGDEGVGDEVAVLVDPGRPRAGGQPGDGVHLLVGA